MSNHATIKTTKPMTAKGIRQLLNKLNRTHLKNNLTITQNDTDYNITYTSHKDGKEYAHRHLWLNGPKNLEIRHGPDIGDFAWWIDFLITNEIAHTYNGTITDEGAGKIGKGIKGQYDNYPNFQTNIMTSHIYDLKLRITILQHTLHLTPPEYRKEIQQWIKNSTKQS